jgi:magnesium-transporting ATPase (P-type)
MIPDDWDTMTPEARAALLLEHENEEAHGEEGSGGILGAAEQLPRTLAFSVLALGQIFHVMAIHRGDKESFFSTGFKTNRLLLGAVILTFLLQIMVVYVPFFQITFETSALAFNEFLLATILASVILFAVEIEKAIRRRKDTPVQVVA